MINEIKSFIEKLNSDLTLLSTEKISFLSCSVKSLELYTVSCAQMKLLESKIKFEDQASEIDFYKFLKPAFVTHFIFFNFLIKIEKFKLENNSSAWEHFFHNERKKLLDFNFDNCDYLEILENEPSTDDCLFYKTESCSKGIYDDLLWEELFTGIYPKFDILRAYYLALLDLEVHLISEIKKVRLIEFAKKNKIMKWNKGNTDAFQHFAGLYSGGYIGDENTNFNELLNEHCNFYNVLIKNHYKIIQEINDKVGPKTNLFDDFSKSFLEFLELKKYKIK